MSARGAKRAPGEAMTVREAQARLLERRQRGRVRDAIVLMDHLQILPTQLVRIAGELHAPEMTVSDYLAEHDVDRDRDPCVHDQCVLDELARGVVPYVFDTDDPVVQTEDQHMLVVWGGIAEQRNLRRRDAFARMMGATDVSALDLAAFDD